MRPCGGFHSACWASPAGTCRESGSISNSGIDNLLFARFTLTIYFIFVYDANGARYILLTRVIGTPTILQLGATVSNNAVNYQCVGTGMGASAWGQQAWKYPAAPFNIATGFKVPVLTTATYHVSSVWTCTVSRNGSSCSFSISVSY